MDASAASGAEVLDEVERVIEFVKDMPLPATWIVGGKPRDEILGRECKDVDFAVAGLTPEELMTMLKRYGKATPLEVDGKLIGARLYAYPHTPKEGIEIALVRSEVSTGPGRHDFAVVPMEVPEEIAHLPVEQRGQVDGDWARRQIEADLLRRDFTYNALAQDLHSGEMLDPLGGEADLRAGIIRAVSDDTFRDDALRAFRMLARMSKDGTQPDEHTLELLREAVPKMGPLDPANMSGEDYALLRERMRDSFDRQLLDPSAVDDLTQQQLLAVAQADPVEVDHPLDKGEKMVIDHSDTLKIQVSYERIREELQKTFKGDKAGDALRLARDTGMLELAIPEYREAIGYNQNSKYHALTVDDHMLLAVERAGQFRAAGLSSQADWEVVHWSAATHDLAKKRTAHRKKLSEGEPADTPRNKQFYGKPLNHEFVHPEMITADDIDWRRSARKLKQPEEELRARFEAKQIDVQDLMGVGHEKAGARYTEQVGKRLRWDNDTLRRTRMVNREHMYSDDSDFSRTERNATAKKPLDAEQIKAYQERKAREFVARVASYDADNMRTNVETLLMMRRCDRAAKGYDAMDKPGWDAEISLFERTVRHQIDSNAPVTRKHLAVNGKDVMEGLGLKGPAIGQVQNEMLKQVIEDPSRNEREWLLDYAKRNLKRILPPQ